MGHSILQVSIRKGSVETGSWCREARGGAGRGVDRRVLRLESRGLNVLTWALTGFARAPGRGL